MLETKTFGAEAKQLLDLMIHSVYSNKEIFLRELVSNASDAIDKRRFLALTQPELGADQGTVTLTADALARTLTVADNGVGMSRQEVIDHIGTIAKSGTREMLGQLKEKNIDLIGQFGVGFYSVFMVADSVELTTRKSGETTATRWRSTGDGTYQVEDAEQTEPGTIITLHLKPHNPDDGLEDFTDAAVLARIVKKHSDFVAYPVTLAGKALNSMKPIWSRPQSEVTEREYAEFYRHISHDWGSPKKTVAFRAEGKFEYQALLFIPEHAPHDLYFRDGKRGLQLYVKRVLIMEQCEALLPSYLRFVRGVVDSADLPLNVSRELLQHDHKLSQMRKRLTKKVIDSIAHMFDDDRPGFEAMFKEFGPLLKEGAAADEEHGEKLRGLLLFPSTHDKDKPTTLKDYVARMPAGQEDIYYISGDTRAQAERSPHLEAYKEKGHEVLFFVEPVDELVASTVDAFDGKPLKSVAKGAFEATADKVKSDADKASEEKLAHLCEHLKRSLDTQVKEVRLTDRLRSSPVCLVSDEADISPHLERLLKQANQAVPARKRILELNPAHAQIQALHKRLEERRDDALLRDYAQLLYGQALLAEGSPLPDAADFARLVAELIVRAESS